MNNSKPWYQSKTIWANLLAVVGLILAEAQGWTFLPDGSAAYLVAALGIVNIVLRSITSQGVRLRKNGT